jgi:hypothetical protein
MFANVFKMTVSDGFIVFSGFKRVAKKYRKRLRRNLR